MTITRQFIKEFATFKHFCELKKQWHYELNDVEYIINKDGTHYAKI